MTDEEIIPYLETVIRWCISKVSDKNPHKYNYYYIGVLDNLHALLTKEETLSQFFERRVLNPHGFPHGKLIKLDGYWIEEDEVKKVEEMASH